MVPLPLRLLVVVLICLPMAARAGLPAAGDYLDTAYMRRLSRSLSPAEAGRPDALMLSVQSDGTGRRVALVRDWREGRLLWLMDARGVLRRAMAWGGDAGTALRTRRDGSLCVRGLAADERCFVRVGDAGRYVAVLVLGGTYRDRQGQVYVFRPDGRAHFPGFDFRYAAALGGTGPDRMAVAETGRVLAYRRAGDRVTLYSVAESGRQGSVLAVLTAVHGAAVPPSAPADRGRMMGARPGRRPARRVAVLSR